MEQDATQNKLIPAPTAGWNSRDPLHAMQENEAIELINYWPDNANVVNRGGTVPFWTCPDTTMTQTYEMFALHTETSGSKASHLFALTHKVGAYKLYRINVAAVTETDVTGGAATFDGLRYSYFVHMNRLYAMGTTTGVTPWCIDATGNALAFTFSGPTLTELMQGTSYKGRAYVVPRNSTSYWYGGLAFINGAMTQKEVDIHLTRGGSIQAVGSFTQQGDNTQNLFIVVSTTGEVLLYQGDYPDSNTWSLYARYFIGKPLGVDCIIYIGGDAHIMCADGIIPVSNLLGNVRNGSKFAAITDIIGPSWADSVAAWQASTTLIAETWRAVVAPQHNMLLVRATDSTTTPTFFAQNLKTQAWTKFSGMVTDRMTAIEDKVLMGFSATTASGTVILEMEKHGNTDNLCYDWVNPSSLSTITHSCRMAFSFLDDLAKEKHITSVKAFFDLVQRDAEASDARIITLGANFDFGTSGTASQVILRSLSQGTVSYVLPCDVRAEGTAFSLIFGSSFHPDRYTIRWNMFIINYETGGFLT